MNSQSNMGNLYERSRCSLFARNYWVLLSHAWGNPKSWERTRRWRNGEEPGKKKPNHHLNKVDLDKSQRDPPVSFATESFRIIWNSFW